MRKNNYIILIMVAFFFWEISGAKAQGPSPPLEVKKPRIILQKIIGSYEEFSPSFTRKVKQILWGNPYPLLERPGYLSIGKKHLYIIDISTAVIHVWNLEGKGACVISGSRKEPLQSPAAVTEDSQERIWVADAGDKKIKVYDPCGKFLFVFGLGQEGASPGGIALDAVSGKVWVSDTKHNQILTFDFSGKSLGGLGKAGVNKGEFNHPTALAFHQDKLYVVDTLNFRIQVFDRQGNFLFARGVYGSTPGTFGRPKALALDSENRLWVGDGFLNRVSIFSSQGEFLGSFGGAPGPWTFGVLSGMTQDRQGNLYVADSLAGKIWVFKLEY